MLKPIDQAYADLVDSGFIKPTEATLSVLPGVTRAAFVLTAAGEQTKNS
jgi:hypothetical protein